MLKQVLDNENSKEINPTFASKNKPETPSPRVREEGFSPGKEASSKVLNWQYNSTDEKINYLIKKGGYEWQATNTYNKNDIVLGSDDRRYISLSDDNINNNPVEIPEKWQLILIEKEIDTLQENVSILGDIFFNSGTVTQTCGLNELVFFETFIAYNPNYVILDGNTLVIPNDGVYEISVFLPNVENYTAQNEAKMGLILNSDLKNPIARGVPFGIGSNASMSLVYSFKKGDKLSVVNIEGDVSTKFVFDASRTFFASFKGDYL